MPSGSEVVHLEEFMQRALIVEDSDEDWQALERLLEPMGLSCRRKTTVRGAVEALKQTKFHIIFTELKLSGSSSAPVMRAARISERNLAQPIIATSRTGDLRSRLAAYEAGIDGFIMKPVDQHRLRSVILDAIARRLLNEKKGRHQIYP